MLPYPKYDIVVMGSSIKLDVGFIGISNITLIQVEDGYILFDVGGPVTRDMLVKGLRDRGLSPNDITKIFLSHLHSDHCLNIDLFPFSTEVFVSKAEWNYADRPHEKDIYIPWLIKEQLSKYRLSVIEGRGDLAPGVKYFPAPGHTPGCYAIKLALPDGSRVTLAGDALKMPTEALRGRADMCFDTQESSATTIAEILSDSDLIIPGHYPPLTLEDGKIFWTDSQCISLVVR